MFIDHVSMCCQVKKVTYLMCSITTAFSNIHVQFHTGVLKIQTELSSLLLMSPKPVTGDTFIKCY